MANLFISIWQVQQEVHTQQKPISIRKNVFDDVVLARTDVCEIQKNYKYFAKVLKQ